MTMGDWLVDKGLDAPRAARPKAPSLNALRRRQGQQYRTVPFGPPHTSANASFGKQVALTLYKLPFHIQSCVSSVCSHAQVLWGS